MYLKLPTKNENIFNAQNFYIYAWHHQLTLSRNQLVKGQGIRCLFKAGFLTPRCVFTLTACRTCVWCKNSFFVHYIKPLFVRHLYNFLLRICQLKWNECFRSTCGQACSFAGGRRSRLCRNSQGSTSDSVGNAWICSQVLRPNLYHFFNYINNNILFHYLQVAHFGIPWSQ